MITSKFIQEIIEANFEAVEEKFGEELAAFYKAGFYDAVDLMKTLGDTLNQTTKIAPLELSRAFRINSHESVEGVN